MKSSSIRLLRSNVRIAWRNVVVHRANLYFQLLGVALLTIMLFFFWTALFERYDNVGGFSLEQMIVYMLSSTLFGVLFTQTTEQRLFHTILRGDIATAISMPVAFPRLLFFEAISTSIVAGITRALPYVASAVVLFAAFGWEWPGLSLYAIPSFLLAYLLHFYYRMIFGTLVFWMMQIHGILYAREFLVLALSGSFIPLWFFPPWLFSITTYLPFRFIFHSPLSMLVGRIQGREALQELALQAVWLVLLYVLSRYLWGRGIRKVVVNGG